jgi:serine/threonine protein kinase
MHSDNRFLRTTRVETVNGAAETATNADSDVVGQPFEPPMEHLKARFEAITRSLAIYYPVAYRLVRELGRGRQGIVFLALRQGARGCITRHAIKIFDPSIYTSAKRYWTDMGRIADQISRLQSVRAPNLVARDAYEETNGIGYVQMEPVDGVDLQYLLKPRHLEVVRERCTPEEWSRYTDVIFRLEGDRVSIQPGIALYIMRQVLRGLEALHEMGYVHSDIKPANVMVDRLGYVKLIDYGRAVRAHEEVTILFGSPLYMAPETHRRQPSLYQSDIYSVGLLGLEMLRGEPLVDARDMTEKDLLQFKMELPDRLMDLLPEHVRKNQQFTGLLRRFVEPDPELRFRAAGDAESGNEGLRLVHKQLVQLGKDTEYGRELQGYLTRLLPPKAHQELDDLVQ